MRTLQGWQEGVSLCTCGACGDAHFMTSYPNRTATNGPAKGGEQAILGHQAASSWVTVRRPRHTVLSGAFPSFQQVSTYLRGIVLRSTSRAPGLQPRPPWSVGQEPSIRHSDDYRYPPLFAVAVIEASQRRVARCVPDAPGGSGITTCTAPRAAVLAAVPMQCRRVVAECRLSGS